jgi:arylsulfatase A-like enzyme
MNISILRGITVLTLIAGSNQVLQAQSNAQQRPNIILMVADDLGYGELGCQGNLQIPTPNIDAIASNGVRFTAGYVSSPTCSPSRAGILTGKYQTRFGYEENPIGAKNDNPAYGLPSNQITMANILHDCGYATGLIGKWHLGGSAVLHPERRGFDEFFGFLHEGHSYAYPAWNNVTSMYRRKVLPDGSKGRWTNGDIVYYTSLGYDEPPYDANNPIIRNSQPVEEHSYLTDAFIREALSFIERRKNQPFFLQLAFNAVHSPLQAKNDDMPRFSDVEDIQRRIFAGMLTSMDEGIGKITQKLREYGLEDNTIIIFLSDNGGPTRELTSSNLPLRGEKAQLYEGGIRVPFMMQWKDKIPNGLVYDNPVISLDILPTVAKIAGVEINEKIDGVDLMPFLTGSDPGQPHDYLFWRQKHMSALRMGDWKIVTHSLNSSNPEWELYNLNVDISESDNMKKQQPDEFEKLYKKWSELNGEMIPPLF